MHFGITILIFFQIGSFVPSKSDDKGGIFSFTSYMYLFLLYIESRQLTGRNIPTPLHALSIRNSTKLNAMQ